MKSLRLILFLLVSTAVTAFQITDQCKDDTCICCADNNCTDNGYCNSGCKAGYPECTVVSIGDDQCRESHCKCCATDKCDMSNGQCSDGCKPGYHGRRCRNKCPENCITCTDHPHVSLNRPDLNGIGYCIECKEGHYLTIDLYQCQSTCSSGYCQSINQCKEDNCKCCANDDCSGYGYCNRGCKPAFPKCIVVSVGDYQCGMSDCKCCSTNRCDTTSGVCSDGCKPGYHGGRCKNKCPENCIKCTDHPDAGQNGLKFNWIGYCTECKEGHFFTDDLFQCQSTCSSGCKACTSKSRCSSCVDGHIPDLQNPGSCILCVTVCLSCQNNGCSSCKEGYFTVTKQGFDLCDKCPDGCLSCESNRSCTKCVDGWYGPSCKNVCSIGCKTTCTKTDGYCECKDEFTGQKCDICISGRYGTNCTETCSKNCSSGCVGNFSGETCKECITGKFGRECIYDCPKKCLNNICKVTSGICEDCYANFTGDTCEECFDGLYGVECNQPCPPNCEENICDQQTGICKSGCSGGHSGDMCCLNNSFCEKCLSFDECDSCIYGKHGQTCEYDCPKNCKHRSCNRINGSCYDCNDGFYGPFCSCAFFHPNKNDDNNIAAPIAGTLIALAILSLTIALMIWYLHRKSAQQRLTKEEHVYYNEPNLKYAKKSPDEETELVQDLRREIVELRRKIAQMNAATDEEFVSADYTTLNIDRQNENPYLQVNTTLN